MKIELHHRSRDIWCSLILGDDRKELASVIPFLSVEDIDAMKIVGYPSDRLPNAIFSLEQLESLEFRQCERFSGIPASLSRFENLCELGFVECADFCDLEGISELEALRGLHIVNCPSFEDMGGELSGCRKLELLEMSHNSSFSDLDASKLPSGVRVLDVRGCFGLEVEELPDTAWPALCSLNAADWSRSGNLPEDAVVGVSSKIKHLCTRHHGGSSDSE